MKFRPALILLTLFIFLYSSFMHAAERLPVEAFARLPYLQQMELSPDGKQFAALLNIEKGTYLITRNIVGEKFKVVLKNDNEKFTVNWFRWLNDERLAVSVRFPDHRMGVATMESRLLSVGADGGKVVNMMDLHDPRITWAPQFQDRVIDWLPDDDDHVLILADLEEINRPGVYRVNVNNGKRKQLKGARDDVVRWITDQQHRVRVGVRFTKTEFEVIYSDPDGKSWQRAWTYTAFSDKAVQPLGFGLDPNILFVSAYHEGRRAVFTADLSDPELPLTLKYADAKHDIDGNLMYSVKTGEVVGITQYDSGGNPMLWDPQYLAIARGIDKALPDTRNFLLDFSRDETYYLAYSVSDTQPGVYYFGDRSSGQLTAIGETYPELPTNLIADKRAISYKARDGVEIEGYLTVPKGAEPRNLPAIVFPHGGPISRDDMEFDYWTAFFADRGYAVLQMNFRGSSGYGHDFMVAGLGQWGLIMQDDITDGVRWMVDSGIADRQRICIVGASYGGYAALMAAATTPELFKCAVSFAGVGDLRALVAHQKHYTGRAIAEEQIGKWWGDRERLKVTSPRLLADRVGVPVLLVHGTKDRSVPFDQSREMASALKKANKTYRFVEFEDGDHHLSRYDHRLQFFQEMEAFLDANLGATATAMTPAAQPQ